MPYADPLRCLFVKDKYLDRFGNSPPKTTEVRTYAMPKCVAHCDTVYFLQANSPEATGVARERRLHRILYSGDFEKSVKVSYKDLSKFYPEHLITTAELEKEFGSGQAKKKSDAMFLWRFTNITKISPILLAPVTKSLGQVERKMCTELKVETLAFKQAAAPVASSTSSSTSDPATRGDSGDNAVPLADVCAVGDSADAAEPTPAVMPAESVSSLPEAKPVRRLKRKTSCSSDPGTIALKRVAVMTGTAVISRDEAAEDGVHAVAAPAIQPADLEQHKQE